MKENKFNKFLKFNRFFTREVKGFAGITHMLIATVLFQIIWILPIFSSQTSMIKEKGIVAVVLFWGIVLGASLMPDLDNTQSTAGYQLGLLGKVMSMFMMMTSGMIYSLFRTKKDHCKSQHRMFWHTPFICIIGFVIVIFFTPKSDSTVFGCVQDIVSNKSFKIDGMNFSGFSVILLLFILCVASFHLFLNTVCYKLGKIFARDFFSIAKMVLTIACAVYLGFTMPIEYIKFMSYGVCIGNLFHNIGDLFSLGSIPLLFPIPIKGEIWHKPYFPFQLETGGMANQILNFALGIIIIILFLVMKGIFHIGVFG